MLALSIHLAAAIRGYLAFFMPTNRLIGWLRSPRGLKWAIPVALVATPAYLFAMSICVTIIDDGGPGYLNVLVMGFAWNALKFAAVGLLTPFFWLGTVWRPAAR
jgi:glucan phosphoethanolaminetransferase (alkaline phosphatase superfamily)